MSKKIVETKKGKKSVDHSDDEVEHVDQPVKDTKGKKLEKDEKVESDDEEQHVCVNELAKLATKNPKLPPNIDEISKLLDTVKADAETTVKNKAGLNDEKLYYALRDQYVGCATLVSKLDGITGYILKKLKVLHKVVYEKKFANADAEDDEDEKPAKQPKKVEKKGKVVKSDSDKDASDSEVEEPSDAEAEEPSDDDEKPTKATKKEESKKGKSKKEVVEDASESDDDEKPTKATKKEESKKASKGKKDEDEDEGEKPKVKKSKDEKSDKKADAKKKK